MRPSIWTQGAALFGCEDIDAALPALVELGWDCFELSTEHLQALEDCDDREARIGRLRERLGALNAAMPQAHAYLSANVAHPDQEKRAADVQRLRKNFHTCAALGVEVAVVHPGRAEGYTTRDEYRQILAINRRQFTDLGDLAGQLGLRIAIENLADAANVTGHRKFGSMPHELLDLLDELDHPAVGICLDTSHMNQQGLDPAGMIADLAPHLLTTHVSDNDGTADQHRIPGDGNIDWPAVMAALAEAGYEGLINLEIGGAGGSAAQLVRLKIRHARQVAQWLVELAGGDPGAAGP